MNPVVKFLVVWLAVLSVGAVELFGARVGYFCDCTGEISPVMTCEASSCHPDRTHGHPDSAPLDDCGSDHEVPESTECPGAHGDEEHSHTEVVESLPLTVRPSQPAAAFPIFFDLAVAMQPSFLEVMHSVPCAEIGRRELPRPLDDRSPPTALVVTRTTVMLV